MIGTRAPAAVSEDKDEGELAAAVIDALLRENFAGLAACVRAGGAGPVLELPGGRGLVLPLRADGFLADLAIAPASTGPDGPSPAGPDGQASAGPGGRRLTLADVGAALDVLGDPEDAGGIAAFGQECRAALAALRLRRRHLPGGPRPAQPLRAGGPGDRHGDWHGDWLGPGGAVRYDALAALMPHPAYPTGACRLGFTDEDSLRYAPEYGPEFGLSWVAIPRSALTAARPGRPRWWPDMAGVGLAAGLAATHELLPAHPLTARTMLGQALTEAGLSAGPAGAGPGTAGVIAPGRAVLVRPTLSTRTVAVSDDPGAHLKLPLPVSTLGLRNRRALVPGTLADGALVHRVLAGITDRDPGLGRLLLADDGDFTHAGHPYLGYLLRRLPAGLEGCRIVPVAALLAAGPDRGQVIDELARAGFGGDPVAFFGAYCELLFGLQVLLFVRYGIALESHQQNAAVVAGPGPAELRLLVKDFDGALINHGRLAAAMGDAAPGPAEFGDPRLLTGSDDALADVFITITVHLCAGALAFGLAERGYAPRAELLAGVRRALTAALDRQAGAPAARLLRARVLEADRLPGKAMITAGTLRDKARTGARDINKFYGTTGPNYLKRDGQ